ncbi:MAG TPA: molybdate ABC transporter substrate-binding protein [Tepidisphaeraceae bacterium]|jgi:molybdate transport system substrate-binding protein|nr:molybdate ABC transporter substrate-binding protein [Tepidisphaeraceae bacterium]
MKQAPQYRAFFRKRPNGNSRKIAACAHVLALVAILIPGASAASAESINVSAAVSMKESLTEIAGRYEADTHDQVLLVFGSSGQLAAQIKNGAPVDVFISAAQKEVDDLTHAGVVADIKPRLVAANELVLIVPADSRIGLSSFDQLKDAAIKRIAVGEPKTVPAGQYAMQVLTGMKLAADLAPRLVYGSNVRQVLDYVERGEVSAGIVYSTDAMQAGPKVKVAAVAGASTHEPIVYPAVIIKTSVKKAAAEKFIDYLASGKGWPVLAAHGFARAAGKVAATAPTN